jgi:lipopolysaccharide transport system permease protein
MTSSNFGRSVVTGRKSLVSSSRWEPLVDAALAAACYLLAYRVRFPDSLFGHFLPYALSTLPLVIASQTGALAALRVYGQSSSLVRLRRLIAGAALGTAVAAVLIRQVHGPTGISRAAFSADFLLFAMTTIGWRTGRLLWRQRSVETTGGPDLVDRSSERVTLAQTIRALVGYRELLKNLVMKDLKLKYRGSVLGFLWSLVNPLVMIAVYTIAFTFILRSTIPGFVFFLMLGTLAWSFFAGAASMSTGAIVDSGSLMKSVTFPRAILPIATVLFNLAQYVLTVLVFLPVMLVIYRVPLSPEMLLYPVFLGLQVLFTIGVAFILAAGTAFFRDIRHLLEIALAILFWMTPILYPIAQVHEKMQLLILLSPLSPFIVAYQRIFYYREAPELTLWVVGLAYAIGTFVVGAWLFLSLEDQLVEQV